jgi:SAM-dependent methyltransferase
VTPADVRVDPASFRDFDSRVFRGEGAVYRALSARALEDFEALEATAFFADGQREGTIVATRRADGVAPPPDAEPAAGCAAVLEHEAVPFLSWPYEWPFAMLKDAALSQLGLMERALAEGMILKDGTPYNTQWRGARPVFIDVGSVERLAEGEPWAGYRQFCMQFLYPLMLQSFRGVPFQPLLRGRLEGIAPADAARLLSRRDRFRRGVLTNVVLHARLERRYAGQGAEGTRRDVRRAGFNVELIKANVRKLAKLVRRLEWAPRASEWSGYADAHSYGEAELAAKERFVDRVSAERAPGLVWDLGCNDGRFSRVAARHAGYVVALDADQLSVDRLYRELREAGAGSILPLTMDLADPSPALGWAGAERPGLLARGRPDLVLALALVHHVTIGANVPVGAFVDWLAGLGAAAVVEFPAREDPMVQRLLSRKRAGAHPDYALDTFEAALGARFEVARREQLGTRVLFEAVPR